MIILDTNVISELMKIDPAGEVFSWVSLLPGEIIFTTAVNQAEVLFGLALMPTGRRRDGLNTQLIGCSNSISVGAFFHSTRMRAQPYAEIVARRQRAGRPIDELDAQIASIAVQRAMAVATRDTRGFEDCGIQVINPWTA